ncbi:hypothetical protein V0288_05670 [Pannus brasiliensis CCIBt3594]|uniref:Uncharacterized protein n=1 Tax=Pannus brasiliensis CCIBt3594 TaxID=1427578 RepID=A0AAW9QQW4_9CHRO
MNRPVNRSTESPKTEPISESETMPIPVESSIPEPPVPDEPAVGSETADEAERNQPIPPPSHPRQYRAIGLVQGTYQRSEDQLTKGNILTEDGTLIDSVVLGRVISLVKNHLDLEKPHLWVVYPRTRQENDALHVQIVGVWEPETLKKDEDINPGQTVHAGYFSIRGEVIFTERDSQSVIVKIRQSPKAEGEKPKFFKLKLKGTLPSKPVSRFWDFQVQLKGDALTIREGLDLGFASKKKPMRGGGFKKPFDRNRRPPGDRSYTPRPDGEARSTPAGPPPFLKPGRPKPFTET